MYLFDESYLLKSLVGILSELFFLKLLLLSLLLPSLHVLQDQILALFKLLQLLLELLCLSSLLFQYLNPRLQPAFELHEFLVCLLVLLSQQVALHTAPSIVQHHYSFYVVLHLFEVFVLRCDSLYFLLLLDNLVHQSSVMGCYVFCLNHLKPYLSFDLLDLCLKHIFLLER